MSTTIARKSPEVRLLKERTQYLNFFSSSSWTNTQAHPTPRDPTTSTTSNTRQQPSTFTVEKRMGSRHCLDIAPFDIWSDKKGNYVPLKPNFLWVAHTYKARNIDWVQPFWIVATEHPSLPNHDGKITLTIGGAPVIFISEATFKSGYHPGIPRANALIYVNPSLISMPDPISHLLQAKPWTSPTRQEAELIFNTLKPRCSIIAMNFVLRELIIELANNGRTYAKASLPSRVRG